MMGSVIIARLGPSGVSEIRRTPKNSGETSVYYFIYTSKNDWMKGRGFKENRKDENETKRKRNAKERRDGIGKFKTKQKTPGGYKFAPLVANQLLRANPHEHACFGLSFPRSFPSSSRSGILLLHAVVQP